MVHIPRGAKIGIAFVILVVGGFLASRWSLSSNEIPQELQSARSQGALIAQDIVNLTNDMGAQLERINRLDKEKNFEEALRITQELILKSRTVRERATELSRELERMTLALPLLKSQDAREAALSSISNRLVVISHLINYSEYLEQLLYALQTRFAGQGKEHQVANWINIINAEVAAINEFNAQAGRAMDRFDAIVRGQ